MCQSTQSIATGSPSPWKVNTRTCVICRSPLIGRSDKVFCDIRCKNKYHIEARKTQRTATAEINKILAKNYLILTGFMESGNKALISKLALTRAGFEFDYVTEVQQENGTLVFGIYDLRW